MGKLSLKNKLADLLAGSVQRSLNAAYAVMVIEMSRQGVEAPTKADFFAEIKKRLESNED